MAENTEPQKYEFLCINGDYVTVKADSEDKARHFAMTERWGAPSGIYQGWYQGKGLTLVEQW